MGLKSKPKASTVNNDSSVPGENVKEALENIVVGGGGIPLSGTSFGNPITGDLQFDAAESKIYKNLPDGHQHYFVMSEAAEVIAMVHDAGTHTCIVGIQHSDNLIGIIKDDGVNPKGIIYNINEDVVEVLLSDLEIKDPTKGVILTGSPNGNRYRITIDDTTPASPVMVLTQL